MGYGSGASVSQFMAHYLLVITISDLADNAIDAIVFESGRFYIQGEIAFGCDRQCHLLWIVFVHLRRSIDLFNVQTRSDNGLAFIKSDCFVGLKYMGLIFAGLAFGYGN